MPRAKRNEVRGAWYHVYHRGLAKRQVFVTDVDYAHFRALLALAVRRREIEVHGYCLLQNHFHLLVRSLGGISQAMKRVLEAYTMRFNRRYDRDGALFSGRYRAKLVGTLIYRGLLLRYINHNPAAAGLVRRPEDYAYSSASDVVRGAQRPWLETSWVREEVALRLGRACDFGTGYRVIFCGLSIEAVALLEERIARPSAHAARDALGTVSGLDESGMLEWFRERAIHADGKATALPVATQNLVMSATAAEKSFARRKSTDLVLARVSLLREMCAFSFPQIGRRLGLTAALARSNYRRHRQRMRDLGYAAALARCAKACVPELDHEGVRPLAREEVV